MRKPIGLLTITCILACLTPFALAMENTYHEDFSNENFRDPVNTTANWNTFEGVLELPQMAPLWLGAYSTSGIAQKVYVTGDLAFVADDGAGLLILDITDPTYPRGIGALNTSGNARDVVVTGHFAFVANYFDGFKVFDISDPTNPLLAGSLDTSGQSWGVAVDGNLALIADGHSGLQLVDITTPSTPAILGTYFFADTALDVAVAGNLAFVALYNGFSVVDISTPTSPVLAGSLTLPGPVWSVAVAGDLVLLACDSAGLFLIDVSDPTAPVTIGSYDTPVAATDVAVSGDLAVVADNTGGLILIDIQDPAAPEFVDTYDSPNVANGVCIAGDIVFLADAASLHVVRVRVPTQPTEIGSIGDVLAPNAIALSGNLALVGNGGNPGLQVLDISDPAAMTLIATHDRPGIFDSRPAVAVAGDLVLQADRFWGLHLFDISDPTNPALIGNHPLPIDDVTVSGDHAYAISDSLVVIDISDPTAPVQVGAYMPLSSADQVVVDGDLAFVTVRPEGVFCLDISDPTNPTFLSLFASNSNSIRDVAVEGNLVFVAEYYDGLLAIDYSNPSTPGLVGSLALPGRPYEVRIVGDYAFLAMGSNGLQVVDISDPSSPVLLGNFATSGPIVDLEIDGEFAYLVNGSGGIHAVQVFETGLDTTANVGQSLPVDGGSQTILKARLEAVEFPDIAWSLSADGGALWVSATPGGGWVPFPTAGSDLVWQTTHSRIDLNNPSVLELDLEWLLEPGWISDIADIPDDQGGEVRLSLRRSGFDFADEADYPVMGYQVYRRVVDGAKRAMSLSDQTGADVDVGFEGSLVPGVSTWQENGQVFFRSNDKNSGFPEGTWEAVGWIAATQSDDYLIPATTLADSTAAGLSLSTFMVTAHTTTPSVWFASLPDSGYSVDNIAPGVPSGIIASYVADAITLDWDDAPEPDFQFYRVYRSVEEGFEPSNDNLLHETAASYWTDSETSPWGYHFKITTLDHAGNESSAGSPSSISSVPNGGVPATTALLNAAPNPFNPSTTIAFELPGDQTVNLRIYDVGGRLVVALLNEELAKAGRNEVVWRGRDADGRVVPAGVYFYGLSTEGFRETKRMTLVK